MGILPDHKLKELGPSLVYPFDPDMVQPASIDLHLDRYFYRSTSGKWGAYLDASEPSDICFGDLEEVEEGKCIGLAPEGFAIASTYERVMVPGNLLARFEGKSSLGRMGLLTHVTAGFIDPGFNGHITLELKNVMRYGWDFWPGMKIGQICFEELSEPVEHPYGYSGFGSHYQGQRGPTLSKSYLNFSKIDVYEKENACQQTTARF